MRTLLTGILRHLLECEEVDDEREETRPDSAVKVLQRIVFSVDAEMVTEAIGKVATDSAARLDNIRVIRTRGSGEDL